MITYGSICSGIEAASVAWEPLGFKPLWFSEIEPFPSAVLSHRWPHVPNLGDMRQLADGILQGEISVPDILVGGTPCQAFSVAGRHESLDDERGNLTLELVRILNAIDTIRQRNGKQPATLVWENVPGIFSTKDNAFGCFLGALAGESVPLYPSGGRWTNAGFVSGHTRKIAWRVLDAQFFGVPQRRRRIFLVASAGAGFDPREVLFEFKGLPRDTAQSRIKRNPVAGLPGTRAAGRIASGKPVTGPILASYGLKLGLGNQEAFSGDYRVIEDKTFCISSNTINKADKNGGNGKGFEPEKSYTLDTTSPHAVAYTRLTRDLRAHGDSSPTLTARMGTGGGNIPNVISLGKVRRLTPIECERLQGFPDNHTCIPYRNKPASACPDTHRYKAIGNSMAVPVMRWIGKRLKQEFERASK